MEIVRLKDHPEYTDAFYALQQEYLPDTNAEICREKAAEFSPVYLCMLKENRLIGICYGWSRKETDPYDFGLTLQGICVKTDFAGCGLGSTLLHAFEAGAAALNYTYVGVGSADGYVEHFYMKNGYHPTCYKYFDEAGCHMITLDEEGYRSFERHPGGFVVFEKPNILG